MIVHMSTHTKELCLDYSKALGQAIIDSMIEESIKFSLKRSVDLKDT